MTDLATTASQLLDKLTDLVSGPVRGLVSTTASSATWLPQGTMGTLPDGRRVRVIKATQVGTSSTAVPCRLEFLAPAYPKANNFAAVANATVVTWVSPPANIAATGTTNAFSAGTQATSLKVGSLVEYDQLADAADEFSAGSNGDVRLILLEPEGKSIGGESYEQRGWYEFVWVLRANFVQLGQRKDQRSNARNLFEKLNASVGGATVGDDVARIGSWKRVKGKPYSWEAEIFTRNAIDGRINVAPQTTSQNAFDGANLIVTLPDDADQPTPFRVLDQTTDMA